MADRLLNIRFPCTGNSARSIMAQAILGREGIGRFRACSAGSLPAGEINPRTIELLERRNVPIGDFRSRSRDEVAAPRAPDPDFVFTVCDNAAQEVRPVRPEQPMTAQWGVPDPAAATGNEAEVAATFADS